MGLGRRIWNRFLGRPRKQITAIYMENSTYDGGARADSTAEFERSVMACLE